MKEALEKLFRHTGVFLVGLIFQRAAKLLLLPLYWTALSRADYGLLELFETFVSTMTLVFSFALPSAYIKFHRIDTKQGMSVESLRGTMIALTLVGLAVLAIALPLFQGPLSWLFFRGSYPRLYLIAGVVVAGDVLYLAVLGFIRAQGRAVAFVAFSTVQFLLLMSFNIYFVKFRRMGIEGVLYGTLLGWGLPAVAYAVLNARAPIRFDWRVARHLLVFAAPLIVFSLVNFAMMNSGRLFLQHFHPEGKDAVAIFSAANRMGLMFALLTVGPFQTAWGYLGLDFLRLPNAREVYGRTFTYLLFGGLWVFLAVSAFAHEFIVAFGKKDYLPALPYVDIMMAGYLAQMFFYWANTAQVARNLTGQVLLVSLAPFALAIVGGWIAIPYWGIWGACVVFTATLTIHALITIVIGRRLIGIEFEWGRVAKIAAAFAVAYGAGRYAESVLPVGRWVISAAEVAAYPALLWLLGFLNQGEIARLRELGRAGGLWTR